MNAKYLIISIGIFFLGLGLGAGLKKEKPENELVSYYRMQYEELQKKRTFYMTIIDPDGKVTYKTSNLDDTYAMEFYEPQLVKYFKIIRE